MEGLKGSDKGLLWLLWASGVLRTLTLTIDHYLKGGNVLWAILGPVALVTVSVLGFRVIRKVIQKAEMWDYYQDRKEVLDAVGRARERGGY